MMNFNNIAEDLFDKIRGRFPSVTIGDESGKLTNVPEDARYFDFTYEDNGMQLGKVSVNLDDEKGVVVIVGRDFVQNEAEEVQDKWYNFLKELRLFAKKRMMSFDIRDINKSNLRKKDYAFLASNRGENTMAESKMYGTNKTSYQKIGNTRIALKHSSSIGEGESRLKNISSIFIETSDGEKFRYPKKHLQGARALAMHVSEGGHPYDDFGKYITGLSEELASLGKFKTYMNRKSVMAETLSQYMDVVETRVKEVRKEIINLQKPAYYKETFDSFSPAVMEDVPSDIAENWIDQLTIKQFNEELKDVFPYVYKLVDEATKAEELTAEDLMSEKKSSPAGGPACWKGKKIGNPKTKMKGGKRVNNCVPEEIELEAAFESMMGQFSEASNDCDETCPKSCPDCGGTGDPEKYKEMQKEAEDDDTMDVKINSKGQLAKLGTPEPEEKQKTPIGEFILSYFDRENGSFPKGETAVLTMVEKQYGEQYVEPAAKFMQKVETMTAHRQAEDMASSRYPETNMIKQLAGL